MRDFPKVISQFLQDLLSRSCSRDRTIQRAISGIPIFMMVGINPSLAQTITIPPQFENAGLFHEGVAPVQLREKWGFIDKRGRVVVPPRFEKVMSGSDGRFAVKENGLWGFIKTNGEIAITPQYEEVKPFSDGVAAFKSDGKWGYVGPTGVVELNPRFLSAGQRYEGHQFVDGGPGIGLVLGDTVGQWENTFNGSATSEITEGFASYTGYDGKRYVFSLSGPPPSERQAFIEIGSYSMGVAPATVDGKTWGYIDGDGKFVIRPSYTKAKPFNGGFAPVRIGNAWGFINRQGRLVVEPEYDNAFAPREGFALIRRGDFRGFLKVAGDALVDAITPQYDDAYAFQEGLAPVSITGKWGYVVIDAEARPLVRDVVDLGPPAKVPVWKTEY